MPLIALYIIAAVIGIFAILFFCRIYVMFSYTDGADDALTLSFRYTFLKIRLVPKKNGKIRLGDYTYEKVRKREEKKKRKQKKKTDGTKKAKKQKKPAKKKDTAVTEPEEGEKKQSVAAMLIDMREMIFDLLKRAPRKLRLEIKRLHLTVGAADAASTAITYGIVTQSVGAALTLAEEHADVRIKKNSILLAYDFLSGKISADVNIRLSIRVGSILNLALRFIYNFIKYKITNTKG